MIALGLSTRTIEINILICLTNLVLEGGPFMEQSDRNNCPSLIRGELHSLESVWVMAVAANHSLFPY